MMNDVTITMLILRVLIRALGILLWERRRCTSLDSTRWKKRKKKTQSLSQLLGFQKMYFDCSENKNTLTVTPGHAAGYLHQDSCVTEDHDDQRQEEEARKGEHVVEGLLPVLDKTPMGGALGEVLRDCDGYIVKYKYLHEKTRRVLLSQRYI